MYIAKFGEELQELKYSMALLFCALVFVVQLCFESPEYVHMYIYDTYIV